MVSIEAALQADADGDLAGALQRIRTAEASLGSSSPLPQRIAAFRAEARILRHHRDPRHLPRAVAAAHEALALSRLPASPVGDEVHWAELELADCLVDSGEPGMVSAVTALTDHPDPGIAAWAWRVLGKLALGRNEVFEAVAALLNAVAEHRRDAPSRECLTWPLLLLAFSRAGRHGSANALASAVDGSLDSVPERLRIEYLLARAEHGQRDGRTADALATLDSLDDIIEKHGLEAHRRQRLRQRATCLIHWCQDDEARLDLADAGPPQEPRRSSTATSRPVITWLGAPHVPPAPEPHPSRVASLLDDIEHLSMPTAVHASLAMRELARLAGVPGLERDEAVLLVRAGALLAKGDDCALPAERLLRRALARLEFLAGTGQWLAQAQVELGMVLADTDPAQALRSLVAGLQGLDEERFRMVKRNHRTRWLMRRVHPAFGKAIELAVTNGDESLAADLIVFSRMAGVLAPGDSTELPLDPVPTLTYIDGTRSSLGTDQNCRLI